MGFWGCGLVGMEENKKSAPPKKNFGYGLVDSIMCGDAGGWGMGVVKPLPRRDAPLQLMR